MRRGSWKPPTSRSRTPHGRACRSSTWPASARWRGWRARRWRHCASAGPLYLDDVPPWEEFTWIGRELAVGGARLRVVERIERCAATNVDPETGARDRNLPLALRKGFGHADMGVYAEVVAGGDIAIGDPLHAPL